MTGGRAPPRWSSGNPVWSSPASTGATAAGPSAGLRSALRVKVRVRLSWRHGSTSLCSLSSQGARCGEGLRFRNVSCFVSDGAGRQDSSSMVDDELCGELEPSVEGEPDLVLQQGCTVPCPG